MYNLTFVKKTTGVIVNIAWPETKVFKASSWYDGLMVLTGYCVDDYYKVGHAALLLIDYRTSNVFYFDFGRYHTPQGFGRVRDVESDPELTISTKANFQKRQISNLSDILIELQSNESNHGDGRLVATLTRDIDFDKAFSYAKSLQDRGAVPYGPFQPNGSNCSRFVANTYKKGVKSFFKRHRIDLSYIYFHTPISNIVSTYKEDNLFVIDTKGNLAQESIYSIFSNKYESEHKKEKIVRSSINLPAEAQCLNGTGCNTWFLLEQTDRKHVFHVKRWNDSGSLEIDADYKLSKIGFDINKPYSFTYISNGIAINISQNGETFELKNAKNQVNARSSLELKPTRIFGI